MVQIKKGTGVSRTNSLNSLDDKGKNKTDSKQGFTFYKLKDISHWVDYLNNEVKDLEGVIDQEMKFIESYSEGDLLAMPKPQAEKIRKKISFRDRKVNAYIKAMSALYCFRDRILITVHDLQNAYLKLKQRVLAQDREIKELKEKLNLAELQRDSCQKRLAKVGQAYLIEIEEKNNVKSFKK